MIAAFLLFTQVLQAQLYACYFAAILFIMSAMAPSPVTLQAVPNESMAIYRVIIIACCDASNPNNASSTPRAAMMAPPGTPGAATIVMPSMKIKRFIDPIMSQREVFYRMDILKIVLVLSRT